MRMSALFTPTSQILELHLAHNKCSQIVLRETNEYMERKSTGPQELSGLADDGLWNKARWPGLEFLLSVTGTHPQCLRKGPLLGHTQANRTSCSFVYSELHGGRHSPGHGHGLMERDQNSNPEPEKEGFPHIMIPPSVTWSGCEFLQASVWVGAVSPAPPGSNGPDKSLLMFFTTLKRADEASR